MKFLRTHYPSINFMDRWSLGLESGYEGWMEKSNSMIGDFRKGFLVGQNLRRLVLTNR